MGYCVPKYEEMKNISVAFYQKMDKSSGGSMTRYAVDFMDGWWVIMVSALIAFLISITYLYLLKWIAKLLIFGSMFGVLLFGCLMTGFCVLQYTKAPEGSDD